ncbi:hypothetical protein GGR54DRAFT_551175 [Hypoxylon sp. NC1633]|nr:hypothetical protein GGR54DRAFT_551175 [Hypoxylon sp. NC1633]
MLETLHVEILHDIFLRLRKKDLNSICSVSKQICSVAIPILYHDLDFRLIEGKDHTFKINTEEFALACEKGYLNHTRHINISAPPSDFIKTVDGVSLIHDDRFRLSLGFTVDDLPFLLKGCKDGALRSFGWAPGAWSMPGEVFGPSGYLTMHQPNIESISFSMIGPPLFNPKETRANFLTLPAFPDLKRLSWSGALRDDFDAVAHTLRQTSHQLIELSLDLGHHTCANWKRKHDHILSSSIIRLRQPASTMFSSLQALSLSYVPVSRRQRPRETFYTPVSETTDILLDAFDFPSLRSLKIHYCPGWEDLLKRLTYSTSPMRLQVFDLQHVFIDRLSEEYVLCPFLRSFQGLEEVFLLMPPQVPTLEIWRGLSNHQTTLRRFAFHQEALGLPEHAVPTYRVLRNVDELPETLKFNLERFSISCIPEWIKPIALRFARNNSLQLLHVGQFQPEDSPETETESESGIHEFLQWAFGPDGMPSLRLFVCGDFSPPSFSNKLQYIFSWKMYCRNEHSRESGDVPSWRVLRDEDWELWDLVEDHWNLARTRTKDFTFYS